MNYIDLIIFAVLIYYLIQGYRAGLVHISLELASLALALTLALLLHSPVGSLYSKLFKISPVWAGPLGFFTVWFIVESGFFALSHYLLPRMLRDFAGSKKDKMLSFIPSVLKTVVFLSVFLSLFVSIPLRGNLKKDIFKSALGSPLVRLTDRVNGVFENIFGGAIKQSLNFVTIRNPGSGEVYDLGFTQSDLRVDEQSEEKMLELLNRERVSRGLKALRLDTEARAVARKHSEDMFRQGYFAHTNKDGKTPCQRMTEGGVEYMICGENLAYAPDVEVAHDGLMNSPGHRANILNEEYCRAGIGVIDGGEYGKMFTQNFAC